MVRAHECKTKASSSVVPTWQKVVKRKKKKVVKSPGNDMKFVIGRDNSQQAVENLGVCEGLCKEVANNYCKNWVRT